MGSGEGLQRPDLSVGDGMYKSTDAGKTWRHLGLRDGQQIPPIIVDPRNPNRLFVAVLGHPYGPNAERGIYRSTDGGATFQKVLYKDDRTGGVDLAFDPRNPQIVYAVLWQAQQGPWENGAFSGPNSGLYKSTDGGDHWSQLTGGLPTFEQGRAGPHRHRHCAQRSRTGCTRWWRRAGRRAACIAPTMPAPPGGASTARTASTDAASDFACVRVDPKNRDVIYVANTSTYRSTDGGQTFTAIKGAPGGDDYHTIWINPNNPNIIMLAVDQGATHQRELRPHLELLVQPADRAVLPRHHRQSIPVQRLRRAAGERIGGHVEPRQRWRDHVPRMASGGRRGVRVYRARPAQRRISFTAADAAR